MLALPLGIAAGLALAWLVGFDADPRRGASSTLVARSLIPPREQLLARRDPSRPTFVLLVERRADHSPTPRADPKDAGPAWMFTSITDRLELKEPINGGEWITRAEAERIATAKGYWLWVIE